MLNKNKIIASLTCMITAFVAIFIFICPVNYFEMVTNMHPVSDLSDCTGSATHSASHNTNDISKKCVDFHTTNVQLYLDIQANTLSIASLLTLITILAFALFFKSIHITFSPSISYFRHRYLFYISKLKVLQERKFKKWLTLLNYHEVVSMA